VNLEHTMPTTIRLSAIAADIPVADPNRFIVGQDADGHWVAVEIHGRAGGLFRSRKDAVDYAEDETDHQPHAVLLSRERIELPI